MRLCKRTKELILGNYKTTDADTICKIIESNNLQKRKPKNIQKIIDELLIKDVEKEERRLKFEKWALKNPIEYRASTLLNGAKERAKKKNIPFNLTKDWIIEKLTFGICEATGNKFYIKKYSKRDAYEQIHPNSPSLDQINPSQGYTMDNVQVVCDQYNKAKNDKSTFQTYQLAKAIVDHNVKKHRLITNKID